MPAKVITFYSYKGGVGRTQALANVAVVLANEGYRVITVDMDLESPGLHAFFSPPEEPARRFTDDDLANRSGLLEFLDECQEQPAEAPDLLGRLLRCTHEALLPERGTLQLLPAGRMDESYPTRVSSFSWERFYEAHRGAECIEYLRDKLCAADADFVLVDSRTGVTDVGSVCTFQLPDIVVVLFALHRQGIDGAKRVGAAVAESRARSGDDEVAARKRRVLFLPTRVIEEDASDRRDEWIGSANDALHPYGRVLSRTGERIPHSIQVAYGEQVVTFPESDDYLAVAYRRLTQSLLGEAGFGETAAPLATEGDLGFTLPEIRRQFGRVQQLVDYLQQEFNHLSPESSTLSSVLGWAQRLVQVPARLHPALDRLGRQLQGLLTTVSEQISLPAQERPNTLREWQAVVADYARLVENTAERYRRGMAATAWRRLLQAAEQDEHEVKAIWPEIAAILGDELLLDTLPSRLPSFELRLQQGSLQNFLRQNRLEIEHFDRRGYTQSARLRWLDEKLEKVEDVADEEDAIEPVLYNLLRLRAPQLTPLAPATAIHWARYDFLCLFGERRSESTEDDSSLDARYFETIGQHLWRSAWESCFSASVAEPLTFDPPAGASCRAQLQRLSEQALDLIAVPVASGLVHRASQNAWQSIDRILSVHHGDPILRRAMHVMQTPDLAVRRRLLALWLCDTHPALEPKLFADYLRTLSVQEQGAHALLALCALLGEHPESDHGVQLQLFDGVYAAELAKLIRHKRTAAIERLLGVLAFVNRLWHSRAGRVLLGLLAGGFCPDLPTNAPSASTLRHNIRFSPEFSGNLPSVVDRHLGNIEQGLLISPQQRGILKTLHGKAVAESAPHMFGNQRFQREFQRFFEEKLAAIMIDKRQNAAILQELDVMDAERWIAETSRILIQSGKMAKNRLPDEAEHRAFLLSFNAARGCLKELVTQCRYDDGHTLQQRMEAVEVATEAKQELLKMLALPPSDPDPLSDMISQLV